MTAGTCYNFTINTPLPNTLLYPLSTTLFTLTPHTNLFSIYPYSIIGGNYPGQLLMTAGTCYNFTIVARDVSGTMRGAGGDAFEVTHPLDTHP